MSKGYKHFKVCQKCVLIPLAYLWKGPKSLVLVQKGSKGLEMIITCLNRNRGVNFCSAFFFFIWPERNNFNQSTAHLL